MEGYLGETEVTHCERTSYEHYFSSDWALEFIRQYGQIEGDHHKLWVLDQVARILNGTPVLVFLAKWDNGHQEYRYRTGNPSAGYLRWVNNMKNPPGGGQYCYDEGIPP